MPHNEVHRTHNESHKPTSPLINDKPTLQCRRRNSPRVTVLQFARITRNTCSCELHSGGGTEQFFLLSVWSRHESRRHPIYCCFFAEIKRCHNPASRDKWWSPNEPKRKLVHPAPPLGDLKVGAFLSLGRANTMRLERRSNHWQLLPV